MFTANFVVARFFIPFFFPFFLPFFNGVGTVRHSNNYACHSIYFIDTRAYLCVFNTRTKAVKTAI